MKTPIQELIEQIKSSRDDQKKGSKEYNAYAVCVEFAEAMLEKEKGVINDAYIIGFSDRDIYHEAKDCYYIETFNTKEK